MANRNQARCGRRGGVSAYVAARRYGPAILLLLAIPLLSLLPAGLFRVLPVQPRAAGGDKLVHTLMYAALTATLVRAFTPRQKATLRNTALVAAGATLYGLALEIAQEVLTTSRSMELSDALANGFGAFSAAFVAYLYYRHDS